MRRLAYIFFVSALAASACVSREQEAPVGEKTVQFRLGALPTKTVFGEKEGNRYPTLWSADNPSISVAQGFTTPVEVPVTPSADGLTAGFALALDAGSGAPYVFRALSPATAAVSLSPSREAWSIFIPSVQTPLEGSPDERAQILSSVSDTYQTLPDEVSMHFSHVTAYGRLSLKNLSAEGAVVSGIELTATTPLCGAWYWNGETLTPNGASSTLTLTTARTEDVWFACAPVDLSNEMLSVTVHTDQGDFVKEILLPENRTLVPGRIAHLSVDMEGVEPQGGSEVYTLVTDASTLAVGDEILIVHSGKKKALGAQDTNYRSPVDVVIENTTISTLPSGAAVVTLEKGTTEGTWALHAADGYLAAQSLGTKNYLVTVPSVDDYASWVISIPSSSDAIVKAMDGTRNWLLYNTSSPRFSCYAGTSTSCEKIQLYRKGTTGGVAEEDPILQKSEYGLYLGSKERRYTSGTDQYSREYAPDYCFTLLNASAKEQLEIAGYRSTLVKGDPVTVSVRWRKGVNTLLEGSYTMKVVGEDGPKVWIGDGTGKGFIIKK